MKKILITGGAGFIGSHVVRRFVNNYPDYQIFNLDALTYAGNLNNIKDLENKPNYTFVKGDICDRVFINILFKKHKFNAVIHLAGESHVDRSIESPSAFAQTNIMGTLNLLDAFEGELFYHISTDEVYGSLGSTGLFTEQTPYAPNSPYSASKAASDHFVRAYGKTYNLPYVISNCSNNYGPNQYPEKLIPLFIKNCIAGKPLSVYGDGQYVRDWLYVEDHARAIDLIFHKGRLGETYNIGGFNEWRNLDLIHLLCDTVDKHSGKEQGSSRKLIEFVKDRPGHDLRYAIDASKLKNELGWEPSIDLEEGLTKTIDWYISNPHFLDI